MVSVYDLKPAFQRLLSPLVAGLHRGGVSPNQVTVLALFLSAATGGMLWYAPVNRWILLVVPAVLFVRMALNALDGMLARTYNKTSPLGEVLNEVGDVLSDAFLYFPFIVFVQGSLCGTASVAAFVFLGSLCELCGVLAKAMVGQRRYDGPMGKSDRAFVIGLYSIGLYVWPQMVHNTPVFFGVLNVLLLVSCFNRVRAVLHLAANPSRQELRHE